jgi:hypothetical protein
MSGERHCQSAGGRSRAERNAIRYEMRLDELARGTPSARGKSLSEDAELMVILP